MIKTILLIILFTVQHVARAQKKDTILKYLDAGFSVTSRHNMVYPAIAFKSNDHWVLYAARADNNPLLTAWFLDKKLTIKDGPYTLYYYDNKKSRQGQYKNGEKLGVWKYWYSNGNLKDSGAIFKDQLVNTWNSWYENGNLKMIIDYSPPDSSSNSKDRISLKNPDLIDNTPLTGYRNGRFIRYYPDGAISDSGYFEKNKKSGLWKIWFQNGQVEATGNFSNDSLQGEWVWYRKTGIIATKEEYRDNKLVSLQCFDEQGSYTGNYCSILKPPVPLVNFSDFQNYMLDNIMLPKELIGKNLTGKVTILCTITKEGKLSKITIEGCPYESLKKEIEKFFLSIPEWSPAILHNRISEYSVEYILPLSMPSLQ